MTNIENIKNYTAEEMAAKIKKAAHSPVMNVITEEGLVKWLNAPAGTDIRNFCGEKAGYFYDRMSKTEKKCRIIERKKMMQEDYVRICVNENDSFKVYCVPAYYVRESEE